MNSASLSIESFARPRFAGFSFSHSPPQKIKYLFPPLAPFHSHSHPRGLTKEFSDHRISTLLPTRSWRNWQTHQLEGLAVAIPWWFESTRPHHFLSNSAKRTHSHGQLPTLQSRLKFWLQLWDGCYVIVARSWSRILFLTNRELLPSPE